MNTKIIEMSAKPVNANLKKDTRSKNASDFRDILNQSANAKPKTPSAEKPEDSNKPGSLPANQESGSVESGKSEAGDIKENTNVSGEEIQKNDKQDISSYSSAVINLMTPMQPQLRPEIKTVALEDGKISMSLMESAESNTNSKSVQTSQAQEINMALTEKTIKNLPANGTEQLKSEAETKAEADIKTGLTQTSESQKSISKEMPSHQGEENQSAKTSEKALPSGDSPKAGSDKDEAMTQDLRATAKNQQDGQMQVIKVKVGDAQKAGSAEFTKEIAKNIDIKGNGDKSYELELDPQNLGKIKVNISFEQGQTNISLTCTNPRTAGILLENASMLAQIIQESNGTTASINVQEESGYLSQEKDENQNQQSRQHGENQRSDDSEEFADQMKLGLWEIENLKRQYQISQTS